MIAVLSNQSSSKCDTKPSAKKSTLTRELKALGLTDPQEESSRSSERSPHPETPQPEGPPRPDIESPAETLVPIKQSASSQKLQKLSEMTNKPSEPPEPSEPDESDSNTSELTRLLMSSLCYGSPHSSTTPDVIRQKDSCMICTDATEH